MKGVDVSDHSSGIFARKNDIFSDMFRGTINAALRSRVATSCLLVPMMFLTTALLWNAAVDRYVMTEGRRVAVPVVSERWSSEGGYTTYYRFAGAGQGNPLRFFDSFFVDPSRGSDIGVAHTYGTQSGCRPESATVTVAYLPSNPRIHVVVEDNTWFMMLLIGTICLVASGALLWNLLRLGKDEAPMALPGWPDA